MILYLPNDRFHYELEAVARMFFWTLEVKPCAREAGDEGDFACAEVLPGSDGGADISVRCRVGGQQRGGTCRVEPFAGDRQREWERRAAVLLFEALSALTGKRPPFGVLTGVRPAKYTAGLLREGMAGDEAEAFLQQHSLVAPDKARLCRLTAETGVALSRAVRPDGFSLYVSIPFCPSRCSYCSFVSKSVERERGLMAPYVDALCRELAHTAQLTRALGLTLQTVYVGGGTPTVLEAEQLRQLTEGIAASFGAPVDGEYCVEAGRPDTVTPEKLAVLKAAGVTRISINPQTGNDAVLRAIGRRHTARDTEVCYDMAREAGFDNINADLIAGLPGDTLESFRASVDWVLGRLRPESVTVHALTLKRASTLRETEREAFSPDAAAMVDHAGRALVAAGLRPYYMYRQKGTVDSLENTGYAKPGYECLYNLFIMDELQSIVACGAGAVTKLRDPKTGHIERIFDLKYPKEYLERFDEMLARKRYIKEFYETGICAQGEASAE